jgi:acyl carrier protein
MASAPWNRTFETVLRRGLPALERDTDLATDVPMEQYGLDSLALIGIVSDLEQSFGINLTGRVTLPVRTLTAGQLWGIVYSAPTGRRSYGVGTRDGSLESMITA